MKPPKGRFIYKISHRRIERMKSIAIPVVALSALAGLFVYTHMTTEPVEVIKEVPTIEVETVDVLSERIETAQEAARPEIEAQAQKAYDEAIASELEAIRQQVTADYIAELEETITLESY